MVKFQIMSDIHIETLNKVPSALTFITPRAEILILAGDIGCIYKLNQLEEFLKDLCSHFQIVLYVLGNHEYYKEREISPKTIRELLNELIIVQKKILNLYILNRDSVVIDDVCITGCTLWSHILVNIPGFVRIKDINTAKYNSMFRKDLKYIKNMISYCKKNKLKLLVVTHHSPTYLVTTKRDRYESLYASNIDYLLNENLIHTWIYGHTHENFDLYTKNKTHLISNQKGKNKKTGDTFSKTKVISV